MMICCLSERETQLGPALDACCHDFVKKTEVNECAAVCGTAIGLPSVDDITSCVGKLDCRHNAPYYS